MITAKSLQKQEYAKCISYQEGNIYLLNYTKMQCFTKNGHKNLRWPILSQHLDINTEAELCSEAS